MVSLVSLIAEATEMAESEMKRERMKDDSKIHKKAFIPPLQPKNVYRSDPENQF